MPKTDAMRLAIKKQEFESRLKLLGDLLGHTSVSQSVEYILEVYLDRAIKAAQDFRKSTEDT